MIKTSITTVVDGDRNQIALDIANRLLRIETQVQGRLDHLDLEVQKGILLQALVEDGNHNYYVIVKAEHSDFINERDNRRATGLPIKKKIFKSFAAAIDSRNRVRYAKVSDSNSVISSYWWSKFLELLEEYTDEHNTVEAFDAIERNVLNKIKEEHPSDYLYLRNATVAYFRSKEEFVLEDYISELIDEYKPESDTLEVSTLSKKISELPEKSGFDGRFNIRKDKIKKRIITRLPLTNQLDLIIKENIVWGETVKAIRHEGAKYLRIRTDEGFDYFDKRKQ
jgi:hypothetical protein